MLDRHAIAADVSAPPRSIGHAELATAWRAGASRLAHLHQSGALKLLFPARRDHVEAILINTSGGITSGDRLSLTAKAGAGSTLAVTTQAAERAYRASDAAGSVTTALSVDDDACLLWLPQELILYEGCALRRRLDVALAPRGRLLMVEPVLFGRAAMGECLRAGHFQDRVRITRDGHPIYRDGVNLEGDINDQLAGLAVAGQAGAMANLVFAAPEAEAHHAALRALLPPSAGASLLAPDLLCLRFLAQTGFALRQTLLPVLDRLSANRLPRSWRL